MSSFDQPDPLNPYRAPYAAGGHALRKPTGSLPTFVLVMMVADLCLCALRTLLVIFSIVGLIALQQNPPGGVPPELEQMRKTAPFEVVSGVGIALFGLVANAAMLARQRWGVIVGWFAVASTVASMLVGLWQATAINVPQGADAEAFRIGAAAGVAIVSALRLGWLGAYVVAMLRFAAWSRGQPRPGPAL
jgi:hypothetical protein